jgi:hypothetical protein
LSYDPAVASFVWLIVWLVQGTPNLEWFGTWNDWAVALLGCAIFDVYRRSRGEEASPCATVLSGMSAWTGPAGLEPATPRF